MESIEIRVDILMNTNVSSISRDREFTEFYQINYPRVVAFLRKRCRSLQDAEDIASESFLYCSKNWNRFDGEKASRSSWLYMIVRSRWKNYCRDHRSFENLDDYERIIPAGDELSRAIWLTQTREELAKALEQLNETQRRAIILRYFANLDDSEIARTLLTTPGNVRVLIHRGLSRLKLLYGENEER